MAHIPEYHSAREAFSVIRDACYDDIDDMIAEASELAGWEPVHKDLMVDGDVATCSRGVEPGVTVGIVFMGVIFCPEEKQGLVGIPARLAIEVWRPRWDQ